MGTEACSRGRRLGRGKGVSPSLSYPSPRAALSSAFPSFPHLSASTSVLGPCAPQDKARVLLTGAHGGRPGHVARREGAFRVFIRNAALPSTAAFS